MVARRYEMVYCGSARSLGSRSPCDIPASARGRYGECRFTARRPSRPHIRDNASKVKQPHVRMPESASPDSWRGLLMPAVDLTVERLCSRRMTQQRSTRCSFQMPAIGLEINATLAVQAELELVDVPKDTTVLVRPDGRPAFSSSPRVAGSASLAADWVTLVSSIPVHASSVGYWPLAALSAPSQADASISHIDGDPPAVRLSTTFSPERSASQTNSLPLLDILGPALVAWTGSTRGLRLNSGHVSRASRTDNTLTPDGSASKCPRSPEAMLDTPCSRSLACRPCAFPWHRQTSTWTTTQAYPTSALEVACKLASRLART